MPPRIYAKHKSTSKRGSEYNTKRGIQTYANIKYRHKVITVYDKHYILHVSVITTKSKVKYTIEIQKAHE